MLDLNIDKLESITGEMQSTLRAGLLAMDVWHHDNALSLAGYNTNPAATALFDQITGDLQNALAGAGFPDLSRYYFLELEDDKIIVVCRGEGLLMAGMLLDSAKANMGILVGVAIPKLLALMSEASHG